MSSHRLFVKALFLFGLSMSIINCSGVRFNASPSNSSQSVGVTPPPDVVDAGTAPGVITGTGTTPAPLLPKVQFLGPPCERQTNCAITFKLDKAYPNQTEFDWKTDDNLYGTPPQPGLAPWGKPGQVGDLTAQYVPATGHVVFSPGQTEQTVYVRNINQGSSAITIGVLMSKCSYGTLYEGCQKFFAQ